jgi:Putative serine esterase (DUF676)
VTVPIRRCAVVTVAAAALLASAGPAAAAAPGPRLTVPAAKLRSALACPRPIRGLKRDPVLLVPATAADPTTTYAWNYQITLPRSGYRFCTVTLPETSLGDIQIGAQYVVAAVRAMAKASGRKVSVIGMSQGGLQPRWALRFWPDLRTKVSDEISLATPHHGTTIVSPLCATSCAASLWQMKPGSAFLTALNRGSETVRGPDWSTIFTRTDDVVTPEADPRPTSALRAARGVKLTSVAVQSICPADTATHVGLLPDAVASALVFDALGHPGPARPSRISRTVCRQEFTPGLDATVVRATLGAALNALLAVVNAARKVPAEPRLAAYART